jgi:uncharacterized protein (TIGR03083 family)
MHPLELALSRLWPAVVSLAETLTDEQWSAPTPLELWSVGDVVAHLAHVEGVMFHGFPQPETPPGWSFEGLPLHQLTNLGVAARRSLSRQVVVDELRRAGDATLARVVGLDEEGWQAPAMTPVGPGTLHDAMELRVADVYVHYLDLVEALGRYEDGLRIAEAEGPIVARAVRLSGWAAVKRAGLAEGTHLRLELDGPGSTTVDVAVVGGRGRVGPPEGVPADGRVAGPGIAYALAAGGRRHPPALVTRLAIEGEAAKRLVETFGFFG